MAALGILLRVLLITEKARVLTLHGILEKVAIDSKGSKKLPANWR